ncbi:hypothetical protein BSKO_01679 [Bryopsis sp. KO-2023]|nr:hypothetical protein BSKO_01679 [Bryopsis sp. KO-2023]
MNTTGGEDADGTVFENPREFWEHDIGEEKDKWYRGAVSYWDSQENSDNGVLGGYGVLCGPDIKGSKDFLRKVAAVSPRIKEILSGEAVDETRAFDGGAGVGRVTEKLLLKYFSRVDLVEPSKQLLDTAEERLRGDALSNPEHNSADQFYCVGLQDFHPKPNTYDCAWLQWCLMYLTDDDIGAFLQTCKAALKPGGVAVVKENTARTGFVVDRDDNSISRTAEYMKDLFHRAGFKLIAESTQRNWPKDLYMVKMYAFTA